WMVPARVVACSLVIVPALVEVNDGYGLGACGLDPDAYAELTVARREELHGERDWHSSISACREAIRRSAGCR
ncbi:MAG: hypothetical protein IT378_01075, partial [Sandaracinaceae bacterium]|nr:hypothetical protein [Sandaracinaceae bacterium]